MDETDIRRLSFYDKEVLLALKRGISSTPEELTAKLGHLTAPEAFEVFCRAFNAKPGSVEESVLILHQARLVHQFPSQSGSMKYLLSTEGYRLQQSK